MITCEYKKTYPLMFQIFPLKINICSKLFFPKMRFIHININFPSFVGLLFLIMLMGFHTVTALSPWTIEEILFDTLESRARNVWRGEFLIDEWLVHKCRTTHCLKAYNFLQRVFHLFSPFLPERWHESEENKGIGTRIGHGQKNTQLLFRRILDVGHHSRVAQQIVPETMNGMIWIGLDICVSRARSHTCIYASKIHICTA